MIIFPNAKINVGLNVVSRRQDGYHNLETLFYPIGLTDILEITLPDGDDGTYVWESGGIDCGAETEKNLCIKALHLLQEERHLPCVGLHLHKNIPTGAGLGGGSSDGAFVVKTLNTMLSLGLTEEQMVRLCSRLGADCAFFIADKPAYATGIGDQLEPFATGRLAGKKIVLVKPDEAISTAEAYAGISPRTPEKNIKDIVRQGIETWADELRNDFEASVFGEHGAISDLKQALYAHGAEYAQMTGSGAAVYGIFSSDAALPHKEDFGDMFYWQGELG